MPTMRAVLRHRDTDSPGRVSTWRRAPLGCPLRDETGSARAALACWFGWAYSKRDATPTARAAPGTPQVFGDRGHARRGDGQGLRLACDPPCGGREIHPARALDADDAGRVTHAAAGLRRAGLTKDSPQTPRRVIGCCRPRGPLCLPCLPVQVRPYPARFSLRSTGWNAS